MGLSRNDKCSYLLYKFISVFILSTMTIILQGCPCSIKPPPYLERVEGKQNHFRILTPNSSPEYKIHRLSVTGFNNPDKVFWDIVVQEPITLKGFEITIGKTPKGFKQVAPAFNEIFVPDSSKVYDILFYLSPPWEGHSIITHTLEVE